MCMKSKSSYMKHKEVPSHPYQKKTTLPAEGDDGWFLFSTEVSVGVNFHHDSEAH